MQALLGSARENAIIVLRMVPLFDAGILPFIPDLGHAKRTSNDNGSGDLTRRPGYFARMRLASCSSWSARVRFISTSQASVRMSNALPMAPPPSERLNAHSAVR